MMLWLWNLDTDALTCLYGKAGAAYRGRNPAPCPAGHSFLCAANRAKAEAERERAKLARAA